jgi:hypothetical protein
MKHQLISRALESITRSCNVFNKLLYNPEFHTYENADGILQEQQRHYQGRSRKRKAYQHIRRL